MSPTIHVHSHAVEEALVKLGLTSAPLLEAVAAGLIARHNCTANHPPFFPGLVQWAETIKVLRDGLAPLGWRRSNAGNFCTVVEPGKRFAIAVAAGDASAGCETNANPSTKRRRGPTTMDAVQINAQQSLFSLLGPEWTESSEEEDEGPTGTDRQTWFLLFYTAGDEIRAELSLPDSIDKGGKINGWRERILLGAQPFGEDTVQPAPDFGPDPTIDVRRRA